MTDREIVLRKLTSISVQIARMRRRRALDIEAWRSDIDLQDAMAMSLLVAVQESLDIALHMASDEGWGVPASYVESFRLLSSHGVIDGALAGALANLASLRNRVAHGYATVDMDRIWSELPAGLLALESFAAAVAGQLGEP